MTSTHIITFRPADTKYLIIREKVSINIIGSMNSIVIKYFDIIFAVAN